MFTKLLAFSAAVCIAGVGCSNQTPTGPVNLQSGQHIGIASNGNDFNNYSNQGMVTFTVRVENVSTDMTLPISTGGYAPVLLSPGVWTVTHHFDPLFKVGQYDLGLGMEQLAEDGNPTNLAASMENDNMVISSGVFNTAVGETSPHPAFPGQAFEFTVSARPGDRLSFATMFAQSNDLFFAPGATGIPLFNWGNRPTDGDVTGYITLWDAGTEVNQEPGIGPDQAPRQSGPNTGESEHMRVWPVHDQFTYPATDAMIKVTITPMMNPAA